MSSSPAPVCNVIPQIPPPLPGLPPLPAVPVPQNLQQAIQAIQTLTYILNLVYNQLPNNNVKVNLFTGGNNLSGAGSPLTGGGVPGGMNPGLPSLPSVSPINLNLQIPNFGSGPSRFTEIVQKRTYATVRVFNPDDKTQYVDVRQITGLAFQDTVSDQTLLWRR